jgi:hypothetical protein
MSLFPKKINSEIINKKEITKIGTSSSYSILLTSEGEVYYSGNVMNTFSESSLVFKKINLFKIRIKHIEKIMKTTTLFVSYNDEVFAFFDTTNVQTQTFIKVIFLK